VRPSASYDATHQGDRAEVASVGHERLRVHHHLLTSPPPPLLVLKQQSMQRRGHDAVSNCGQAPQTEPLLVAAVIAVLVCQTPEELGHLFRLATSLCKIT
jgi:hypothetical protein